MKNNNKFYISQRGDFALLVETTWSFQIYSEEMFLKERNPNGSRGHGAQMLIFANFGIFEVNLLFFSINYTFHLAPMRNADYKREAMFVYIY